MAMSCPSTFRVLSAIVAQPQGHKDSSHHQPREIEEQLHLCTYFRGGVSIRASGGPALVDDRHIAGREKIEGFSDEKSEAGQAGLAV